MISRVRRRKRRYEAGTCTNGWITGWRNCGGSWRDNGAYYKGDKRESGSGKFWKYRINNFITNYLFFKVQPRYLLASIAVFTTTVSPVHEWRLFLEFVTRCVEDVDTN